MFAQIQKQVSRSWNSCAAARRSRHVISTVVGERALPPASHFQKLSAIAHLL